MRSIAATTDYHNTRLAPDGARSHVWRAIAGYLQRFVPENASLLDLGAGYGDASRYLTATRKWAVDVSEALRIHWAEDVTPVFMDLPGRLPIPDGTIAATIASNFFEHFTLDECIEILNEIQRITSPHGRLIVVQPNFRLQPFRYFDDYTHRTPFTDAGFCDLLRSLGWTIVRSEPRFLPFSMKSRLPKWGWLVRLYLALPYRPAAGQFLVVASNK